MIENDPERGDTLLENEKTSCFKKHLMTIIFIFLSIVIISVIIVIVILLKGKNKDNNSDKPKDKDDDDDSDADANIYGLNITELRRRTSKEFLSTIDLLKENAPEYENLAEGDKKALYHLVKAAQYLENVEYQIDDQYNYLSKNY